MKRNHDAGISERLVELELNSYNGMIVVGM